MRCSLTTINSTKSCELNCPSSAFGRSLHKIHSKSPECIAFAEVVATAAACSRQRGMYSATAHSGGPSHAAD